MMVTRSAFIPPGNGISAARCLSGLFGFMPPRVTSHARQRRGVSASIRGLRGAGDYSAFSSQTLTHFISYGPRLPEYLFSLYIMALMRLAPSLHQNRRAFNR